MPGDGRGDLAAERLRALLLSAAVPVAAVDDAGCLIGWNQPLADLAGLDPERDGGRLLIDLVDGALPRDLWRGPVEVRFTLIRGDGGHVAVRGRASRLEGHPEVRLLWLDAAPPAPPAPVDPHQIRHLLERAPVAVDIGRLGEDGRRHVLFVNDRMVELAGTSRDAYVAKGGNVTYADEKQREVVEAAVAGGGEVRDLAVAFRDPQGRVYWTLMSGSEIVFEGQRAAITWLYDISEVRRAEQALRMSERKFRDMFQNHGAIMFLAERGSGRIADVNAAALAFYGYPADVFLTLSVRDLEAPSRPGTSGDSPPLRHRLASGEVRDVEIRSTPIAMPDGSTADFAIVNDVTVRQRLEAELKRTAATDPLTGAFNRRHFFERADLELRRLRRTATTLAVLMLDVDRFKVINDTFGHDLGDEVLRRLTAVTRQTLRETDELARFGGEEFALLLPDTDSAKAFETAERLRRILALVEIDLGDAEPLRFTVSIGVSIVGPEEETIEPALKRADQALYRAKREGRDRVVLSTPGRAAGALQD
ncbi:diguanylate cyclase [Zavarzinia sp. CC-PAN008]|uniref:diguanylate cyclase n=1 Tax=Zavarzinia sp. CC-PAN008 TaxID=3243332 RepID=UPI003F742267